jgi:hypothetical protein
MKRGVVTFMNCLKCGKMLNIRMSFIGYPTNQPREYYCQCGAEFIGTPSTGEIKEIEKPKE